MFLKSTPYIKLRKANGLLNIDYTKCDIIFNDNIAAARSYNTIIGVYTRDSTGTKIYLETSGSYSTTTATKHKPRAASIAAYNNYHIVTDIKPEVLKIVYYSKNPEIVDNILKESQQRQELLNELKNNVNDSLLKTHLKVNGTIKADRTPEHKQYKNGNSQTKYYYRSNFQYCQQVTWQENKKHIKKVIPGYNGPKGPKPERTTYTITNNIVNIGA